MGVTHLVCSKLPAKLCLLPKRISFIKKIRYLTARKYTCQVLNTELGMDFFFTIALQWTLDRVWPSLYILYFFSCYSKSLSNTQFNHWSNQYPDTRVSSASRAASGKDSIEPLQSQPFLFTTASLYDNMCHVYSLLMFPSFQLLQSPSIQEFHLTYQYSPCLAWGLIHKYSVHVSQCIYLATITEVHIQLVKMLITICF